MAEFAPVARPPLPVDYKQNGVQRELPGRRPGVATTPGDHVTFDVAAGRYSNAGDPKDTDVTVKLGATTLGTFPLDNTVQAHCPASTRPAPPVDVVLPPGCPTARRAAPDRCHDRHRRDRPDHGRRRTAGPTVSAPDSSVQKGQAAQVVVTVTPADADGTVSVLDGARSLGTATLASGSATVTIPANLVPAVGVHELDLAYSARRASTRRRRHVHADGHQGDADVRPGQPQGHGAVTEGRS